MIQRPVAHIRWTECVAVLSVAVRDYATYEDSREFLAKSGLKQLLTELASDNLTALLQIEETGNVRRAVLNRPELLHFAELASANSETVSALVRAVSNPIARRHFPLAAVWAQYADALVAFQAGALREDLPPAKAAGSAARYLPYIRFMCAESADWSEAIQDIQLSFAKWNSDKRATDWLGLDGDGKNQVRWDFRLAALRLGANNSFKADGFAAA